MNPIRVLLLDDHALFREGLSRILGARPEFTVVRAAGTVDEAMGVLASQPVDVILLDLELKGESGIDMLHRAMEFGFAGKILIVAADVSPASVRKLVDQGAAGVFLKSDPPEMLIDYIHRARDGEMAIKQQLLVAALREPGREPGQKALTAREKEILRHILAGQSNKEIALTVNSSESAVKGIVQQLFQKMGVRSRSQLVRMALEHYQGQLSEV